MIEGLRLFQNSKKLPPAPLFGLVVQWSSVQPEKTWKLALALALALAPVAGSRRRMAEIELSFRERDLTLSQSSRPHLTSESQTQGSSLVETFQKNAARTTVLDFLYGYIYY